MNELEPPALWERQPWDTDSSYIAFRLFLAQPAPRRIVSAYEEWCKLNNKAPARRKGTNAAAGYVAPASSFREWVDGRNAHGERPPGTPFEQAVSWRERAHAWDREQDRIVEAMWAERRQRTIEQEYQAGSELHQRALKMLAIPPVDFKESDIATMFKVSFDLMRRALGMEQSNVTISWRNQLKQAGIDPSEVFEDLVAGIMTQMTGGHTNETGSPKLLTG